MASSCTLEGMTGRFGQNVFYCVNFGRYVLLRDTETAFLAMKCIVRYSVNELKKVKIFFAVTPVNYYDLSLGNDAIQQLSLSLIQAWNKFYKRMSCF